MANSADPDQLASSEANWSGSTLFAKQGISRFSRTRVKKNTVYIGPWVNGYLYPLKRGYVNAYHALGKFSR